MKRVALQVAESGDLRDLAISPGTTSREILSQAGLDNQYLLSRGRGTDPFGEDENVYESIPDGSKLYAVTPVEVGNRVWKLLDPSWQAESRGSADIWIPRKKPAVAAPNPQILQAEPPRIPGCTPVKRDNRPVWQQKGWKRHGKNFLGYYRTKSGSWKGKVSRGFCGTLKLHIHKPPSSLRKHEHWSCFHERLGQWFWIHTYNPVKDLSSGILQVEQILKEAHQ